MTTDTDTKQDTIQRPARAWRNWFASTDDYHETSFRRVSCSETSFATKAEAEAVVTGLAEQIAKLTALGIKFEYLGAYPEGTRP